MPDSELPLDGHLWLIDYAGHPFTAELASELNRRGQALTYSYCSSNATPHADFERLESEGVRVSAVDLGRPFAKHRPFRRALDEIDYGVRTAFRIVRSGSSGDRVIACQVPVLSALIILTATRLRRQRFTLWLQDIQSGLASLSSGHFVATVLKRAENLLLRRSPRVLAISDQFADETRRSGNRGQIAVLPNWAPLSQITPSPRTNEWSERNDVAQDTFRVVYSGTLGSKHRGPDVAALAKELLLDVRFEIVVVATGEGVTHLEQADDLTSSDRFHLLPLQPVADLSDVLSTADCLLVTLDDNAGESCVPSKVLSYLCAARPIICLMPIENPSAKLVHQAGAGQTVRSTPQAAAAIRVLAESQSDCNELGLNGRKFAESNFDIGAVTTRFMAALTTKSGTGSSTSSCR